jgi:hypothetical protein
MELFICRLVSDHEWFGDCEDDANDDIGGGIVYDSDEYDEYIETINKLGANMQCIVSAEKLYARRQGQGGS